MGDTSKPSVRMGNLLTARTVLLLLVAAAKGCWWVCEQPATSLMEKHVLFQRLLRLVAVHKLRIRMSDYGAPTPKPTILYSSPLLANMGSVTAWLGHQAIESLSDFSVQTELEQRKMVRHYVDGSGKSRVTGSRDLKASQAYPRQCHGCQKDATTLRV